MLASGAEPPQRLFGSPVRPRNHAGRTCSEYEFYARVAFNSIDFMSFFHLLMIFYHSLESSMVARTGSRQLELGPVAVK